MDIITGDGGFDFSVDFNMQEELAQKLIYSQIIIGFAMLKKGGTFICKFFDTFTNLFDEGKSLTFVSFGIKDGKILYEQVIYDAK